MFYFKHKIFVKLLVLLLCSFFSCFINSWKRRINIKIFLSIVINQDFPMYFFMSDLNFCLKSEFDLISHFSFVITWPKNFVFGQVLLSSAFMCLSVCLSVCLYVSLYIDYLKNSMTDFNENLQEDDE